MIGTVPEESLLRRSRGVIHRHGDACIDSRPPSRLRLYFYGPISNQSNAFAHADQAELSTRQWVNVFEQDVENLVVSRAPLDEAIQPRISARWSPFPLTPAEKGSCNMTACDVRAQLQA